MNPTRKRMRGGMPAAAPAAEAPAPRRRVRAAATGTVFALALAAAPATASADILGDVEVKLRRFLRHRDAAQRRLQQGEAESYPGSSNCVEVGGGIVPTYDHCVGCDYNLAQACINDMRANATGNVPIGCDMARVIDRTFGPAEECCVELT
mmetsp:Transcript_6857/g.19970  ORF Transcript_6857/g.19970 Transcript_6857/m.19970 type:complete len:151 (-) Transcript_6857:667-1119(-)